MAEKITSYVHLTISTAARGIKQQSAEIPLLFGYHTKWAEYVRSYSDLAELTSDGFAVTDPLYLMAKALLSQDRRVSTFKVGRRATAGQHAGVLTITQDTGTIAVTISKGGTTRTYTQTGGGGGIAAEATALALAMNNDADGWGSSGSAELTIAAASNDVELDAAAADGQIWYYEALSNMTFDDATPDPGIAADLTALRAEDDNWYAITLDSCSGAEGEGLAAALSSATKLVAVACQDNDCATGGGLLGTFNTQAYTRAFGIYKKGPMSEYVACASLGYSLPWPPGSLDWMFKSYQGVTADDLTTTQISGIKNVYGNMYVQVYRDAGIFQIATVGSGQYIDIAHLKDYLTFRIEEAIWDLLRAGPKLPYTDKGARTVGNAIKAVLKSAQTNAVNAGGDALSLTDSTGRSTFQFNFTPADSQLAADKTARIFRGMTWQATLSSSMREIYITGELV